MVSKIGGLYHKLWTGKLTRARVLCQPYDKVCYVHVVNICFLSSHNVKEKSKVVVCSGRAFCICVPKNPNSITRRILTSN